MQPPNLEINYAAVFVAALAAFVIGGVWYGPLFGKRWAGYIGMDMTKKPAPGVMRRAFTLQAIGLLLTAYVMAHLNVVWRPSVWGAGTDHAPYIYGFFGGLFAWMGFQIPLQFGKISWEMRPWGLFIVNAGHDFVTLQVISQIVAHWR